MEEQNGPPELGEKSNPVEVAADSESEENTASSESESPEITTASELNAPEIIEGVPRSEEEELKTDAMAALLDASYGFYPNALESRKDSETEAETDEEEAGPSGTKRKKAKRMRCPVCQKKLTVVNQYECRCGIIFCSTHRYPESHSCTFDYKEEGKRILTLENPLIVAPKLTKI